MRRALGAVIALAAVSSIGIAACGPIATRVMRTGAERALSADPIADLPDGLHVALCGAGGSDAEREPIRTVRGRGGGPDAVRGRRGHERRAQSTGGDRLGPGPRSRPCS